MISVVAVAVAAAADGEKLEVMRHSPSDPAAEAVRAEPILLFDVVAVVVALAD